MTAASNVCNGFRIRGLNQDADRVAVQSTHQTTWQLGGRPVGVTEYLWHEVGLAQNELVVLRPYNGTPELEMEPLGESSGVLIVEATRQFTRTVRVGRRIRLQLGLDESVVLKTEHWRSPRGDGANLGQV